MCFSERTLEALDEIGNLLEECAVPWLVGGSCGLVLQGVAIGAEPRDLDLYADLAHAGELHKALSPFAVDRPEESRTGIYRSKLSHYLVKDIPVELVGGFEVSARGCLYNVEVEHFLYARRTSAEVNGRRLPLMPLAHELVFNLLRDRPDRYDAIVAAMWADPGESIGILKDLVHRNRWSGEIRSMLGLLLRAGLPERKEN